jgi:hypothetical protein
MSSSVLRGRPSSSWRGGPNISIVTLSVSRRSRRLPAPKNDGPGEAIASPREKLKPIAPHAHDRRQVLVKKAPPRRRRGATTAGLDDRARKLDDKIVLARRSRLLDRLIKTRSRFEGSAIAPVALCAWQGDDAGKNLRKNLPGAACSRNSVTSWRVTSGRRSHSCRRNGVKKRTLIVWSSRVG